MTKQEYLEKIDDAYNTGKLTMKDYLTMYGHFDVICDPETEIQVLVKNPHERVDVRVIPNTLEALQELVGGYIETVTFYDAVIICNEEGRIRNLPYNCTLTGVDFYGPIIICGSDGENFTSVPDEYIYLGNKTDN